MTNLAVKPGIKPAYISPEAGMLQQAATMSAIGGVGQIAQAGISFLMAGVEKQQAKNRAAQIKLQAEQRSNQLLASFNQAIGNAQYGAARRGVKAGEGSVLRNIEMSAKDVGTDIDMAKKNARLQASTIETQAKINQGTAFGQSLLGAGAGFASLQQGRKYRQQAQSLIERV